MLSDWNLDSVTFTRTPDPQFPQLRASFVFQVTHKTDSGLNFSFSYDNVSDQTAGALKKLVLDQVRQRDLVITAQTELGTSGTLDLTPLLPVAETTEQREKREQAQKFQQALSLQSEVKRLVEAKVIPASDASVANADALVAKLAEVRKQELADAIAAADAAAVEIVK